MDDMKGRFQWKLISRYRSEIMGTAMILVLLCHSDTFSWGRLHPYVHQLAANGTCGVDIFLFVSGFGCFYSMLRDSSALHFYRRRFARVFPEYLLISAISYGILNAIQKNGWNDFLIQLSSIRAAFLYTSPDNRALWYMFFLLFAYLLFPAAFIAGNCGKRIRTGFFILGVIISYSADVFLCLVFPDFMTVYSVDTYLSRIPVFLLGIYYGYRSEEGRNISKKAIPVLFVLFILLRFIKIKLMGSGNEIPAGMILVKIANQCLAGSVMISTALLMEKLEHHQLKIIPAVLRWTGRASLELYLLHGFCIMIWHALGLKNAWYIYFTVIIPVTVLIAELMMVSKRMLHKAAVNS